MIIDARSSSDRNIEAEICVVGAGPAGIVLAQELANLGHSVVLVEGGGHELPGEAGRALYEAEVGERAYPVHASRLRYFGGTSNHWGGWSSPLSEVEWVDKPHFDLPGWPFPRADLDDYYQKAVTWCEIPSGDFSPYPDEDPSFWFDYGDEPAFEQQRFMFSPPTRFGPVYREAIEQNPNIQCLIHLNALKLQRVDGQITGLTAHTLDQDEFQISADRFVLAMGGLEIPRFLLNQAENGADVPGNQSDLVGACFMDHYGFSPGYILAEKGLHYHRYRSSDVDVQPVLTFTPEFLVEQKLNNTCMMLTPVQQSTVVPNVYLSNPGYSGGPESPTRYSVLMLCEPTPDTTSRVLLTDNKDQFGMAQLKLDWRIPQQDWDSIQAANNIFAKWLGKTAQGRYEWKKRPVSPHTDVLTTGMHHIGTTRMSDSPETGVVDADCKVYGTDNLYIASSSVFPYAGFSNPTLTIVAMASRLADHLHQSMGGSSNV